MISEINFAYKALGASAISFDFQNLNGSICDEDRPFRLVSANTNCILQALSLRSYSIRRNLARVACNNTFEPTGRVVLSPNHHRLFSWLVGG